MITVYTHRHCKYCIEEKEWMLENNISFEEKDVSKPEFNKELSDMSVQGVPHTIINKDNYTDAKSGFNPDVKNMILKYLQ